MCFRQRQTKPKETKVIWKISAIIVKGKKGPQSMRLFQEQGNTEQPLTCCLWSPFPTRKQIREETGEQISEIQNILSKITVIPRPKVTPSPGHLRSHCPSTAAPWCIPSRFHNSCAAPQEPTLNSGHSADTPDLSEEKSVRNLLLGITSLFILLSKAWTAPTDKNRSHRTPCHQHPRVTYQWFRHTVSLTRVSFASSFPSTSSSS